MSEDDKRDDARKIILARRARFVAAAMAGLGVACGKTTRPEPCLSEPAMQDDASPQPCLSVTILKDAGAPAVDASAIGPMDAGAEPMPCLSVRPEVTDEGIARFIDAGGLERLTDAGATSKPLVKPPPTNPPPLKPPPEPPPPRPCLKVSRPDKDPW